MAAPDIKGNGFDAQYHIPSDHRAHNTQGYQRLPLTERMHPNNDKHATPLALFAYGLTWSVHDICILGSKVSLINTHSYNFLLVSHTEGIKLELANTQVE